MGGSLFLHRITKSILLTEQQYYFTYCEAGYNTKTLGDMILTVGREGAMEMLEEVPL